LPKDHSPPSIHRIALAPEEESAAGPEQAPEMELAMVEAALFCADEPITPRKLATVAGLEGATEARKLVRRLRAWYGEVGSAFQVEEVAGGYQILTRPEFHAWLIRLRRSTSDLRLSGPARETLAIIAYRQPITRADIEAIRGVQCADVLRLLMEKGLIRIAGRHDSLGRPVLYGTTKKFLQAYGLKNLTELPQAEQLWPPGARQ
jgi:segregation and condensation protein B